MKTRIRIITLLLITAGIIQTTTAARGTFSDPDTLLPGGFIRIDTFNIPVIPPSSGVQFYQDGIIYLSSSRAGTMMLPEHVSFGKTDAFYAAVKETNPENPRVFSPGAKFPYPTDAVTFTKDYKTMYFTRFNDADGVEKIFRADFSEGDGGQGKWTIEENPLSFCTGKYIFTHPALSADGKILIFASNQTGSLGGMDLFITQNEGGSWSQPENLGDAINTRSNEMYPFLDSDNTLYYSSDGLLGYGGYDIFVCKFKGNTWDAPINLAAPVNTVYDDVALTIGKKDGKSAFYTLKEKGGKKSVKLLKISLSGTTGPDRLANLSQFFTNPASRNIVMLVTEPAVEATDRRATTERPRGRDDNIVYRVQILTSFNPKTRQLINLEGRDYSVYEYLYSGAYRLCVGEFNTITPAIELRNKFIQNDYPQATVVVFRNNVRSFDPDLLEEAALTAPPAVAEKPKVTEPAPTVQIKEEPKKEAALADTKKTEPAKQPLKEPVAAKTETAKTTPPPTQTKPAEPVKTVTQPVAEKKDIIVYRVQFASSTTKKGSYTVTIGSRNYTTWEYQYSGAYRSTVGEFKTLAEATAFQKTVRQAYPQAFVVAFKNDVRSTDPALFK